METLLREELLGSNSPFPGVSIKSMNSVSGGCINYAWKIVLEDGKKFFLKTNSLEAFKMLECEADGLSALKGFADEDSLVVPRPLAVKKLKSFSILLLPWLNLSGSNQSLLGSGLAKLHKTSSEYGNGSFGCERDGFIGSNVQPGGWRKDWGSCFYELRLLPQLNSARNWGLQKNSIYQISSKLVNYLNQHQPIACLVHGDLWSGNSFVQLDGKGILLDPAAWWADREVDIAMTKMFGGYSEKFYKSYQEIWPLPVTAKNRIEIYNFYHLLNHANLFGGSYCTQSLSFLSELKSMFLDSNKFNY